MFRKLLAEFIGTFWLVFGGCGAALIAAGFPSVGIGFMGVAFAFGLTVVTMAYAVGPISGGHFNPAVSFGLAIAGRLEWVHLIGYWIAQIVGGAVGAAVLYLIVSGKTGFTAGGFASNGYDALSPGAAKRPPTADAESGRNFLFKTLTRCRTLWRPRSSRCGNCATAARG